MNELIWKARIRIMFEEEYDELGDEEELLDRLELKSFMVRELIREMWEFVEAKKGERNTTKLEVNSKYLLLTKYEYTKY